MNLATGTWEISGNLKDINGYTLFSQNIACVFHKFIDCFGVDVMTRIDLYVDNAISMTGHTPIVTPILKKYLIIKLGVDDFSNSEKTVFQFAHELCHYVFYSLKGFDKEKSTDREESVCAAMSLVFIKTMFPNNLDAWKHCLLNSENKGYRLGVKVASDVNFEIMKLRDIIISF